MPNLPWRARRAADAEESRVDRIALLSASAAIISALIAVPGAIYTGRQLYEINQSADSAAKSLEQAERLADSAEKALATAQSLASSASLQAAETRNIAVSTSLQADQVGNLVTQTREQARETARIATAASAAAKAGQGQLNVAEAARVATLFIRNITVRTVQEGKKVVFDLGVDLRSGVAPDVVHMWNMTGTTASLPATPTFPQCRAGSGWKVLEYGNGTFTLTSANQMAKNEAAQVLQNKAMPLSYGKVCFTDQTGRMRDIIFCGYRDQSGENVRCDRDPGSYR